MRKLLQPVRFLTILLTIFIYLTHMGLVRLLVRQRWRRVQLWNRFLSLYSHWGLFVFGLRVNPIGRENLVPGALYVGNHLSYLDVLVISSQLPTCYVTSQEIRETPVLGLLCEMSGCLFVERRNRTNLRGEVAELSEGLRHGLNVAIFPEATSTNGERILRFRRSLYLAAMEAGKPVVPFCQNYRMVGGQPITRANRDLVFWYGDMDFAPHLWALCGSGGATVDLHILTPVSVAGIEDPGQLAEMTQRSVESVFRPV